MYPVQTQGRYHQEYSHLLKMHTLRRIQNWAEIVLQGMQKNLLCTILDHNDNRYDESKRNMLIENNVIKQLSYQYLRIKPESLQ